MGLLQLKLFLFLLISAVCPKISAQAPTCGNNTFFIQYPFKLLQEGPNSHHISPYDLKCNRQGVVVLNLPSSGEFYVRNIDYFEQKIQLYDPSNCLPKRLKNLSLSSSPFVAVSYQKYTFFSCPLESLSSRNFTAMRCLSNSTASVIATSENSMMDEIKNLTVCKVIYSLQIPVSQVLEYVYNGIDGDLQLAWRDPSSKGDSRGKTSSKPGGLTILLICAVIISTALLVSLFCIGCSLSIIEVMLDIEEANDQRSWRCSTRVWEMARIRFSTVPRVAEAPLDEVSFVSSTSQQLQPSSTRGASAPLDEFSTHVPGRPATSLDESSFMPPPPPPPPLLPPSIAAVHPFGYFLSFMPSPEVPRGAGDPLDGSVSFVPSPEIPSMAAAHDGEFFTDAAPPDDSPVRPSVQVPEGAAAPLDESSSTPPPPSIAAANPFGYFLSFMPSPRGTPASIDELPSVVSFMPSPEVQSMPTAHDDDDSSFIIISSPQAPLDESSPTPPPPSVAEGHHPFDYFFSLLSFSAQFRRGAAASNDELSSTPSTPSVDDYISVIQTSPQRPGMDADAFEDPSVPAAHIEELPTEDIIIGGSECIFGPNGESCPICLGEYKASERLRLITKCNHCFHADCLDQWLQRKKTCPICRTRVI